MACSNRWKKRQPCCESDRVQAANRGRRFCSVGTPEQEVEAEVGSAAAILSVSIRRRARQDLKETAEALALWLHASTEALLDREVGPTDIHHQRMDNALEDARATLWNTGTWVPRRRLYTGMEKCRSDILALTLADSSIEDTRAKEHLHAIGWAWATLASQIRRIARPVSEKSGSGTAS